MKNTLLILLGVLLCTTLFAQAVLRPQVGISFSSFTDNLNEIEFNDELGYSFGADLQIGNKLYIQPGFFLDFRKNEGEDDSDVFDLNRTNLRIPLYIGYNFGYELDGDFGFRIFAGPNFLFNIDDTADNIDSDLEINDTLWAATGGVGLDISIFFVDAGYELGLSEVFKDIEDSPKANLFFVNAGLRTRF